MSCNDTQPPLRALWRTRKHSPGMFCFRDGFLFFLWQILQDKDSTIYRVTQIRKTTEPFVARVCSRWFLGGPSKLIATFLSWREEGATPAGCRYQQHIQQGPRLFQWGKGLSGLRPSIKADWNESHRASIAIWWPNREVRIIKKITERENVNISDTQRLWDLVA